MPLKSGKSRRVLSQNVRELLRAFKKTGRIGKAHPKDMERARKMALAVAYQKRKGK